MDHPRLLLPLLCCCALAGSELHELPVTAVTVFKDGHALLTRSGTLPIDQTGRVRLEHDLEPVLGSFWIGSDQELRAVTAATSTEDATVPISDRRALLEANIGRRLQVQGPTGLHGGRLQAILDEGLALQEDSGQFRILRWEDVHGLRLPDDPILSRSEERQQRHLELQFAVSDGATGVSASYLQQGIRWIPQYRISLLGDGRARIELQASLINDLIDLRDVDLELVVGVPRFDFAAEADPLALKEHLQALDQQVQRLSNRRQSFSNMLRSQVVADELGPATPAGPRVTGSDSDEDLFVFSLKAVSLAAGARMTVPVVSYEIPYEDIFVLGLPMNPPQEGRRHMDTAALQALAEAQLQPPVEHRLRLRNDSRWPFTTAPALIRSGTRVLAQTLLRYTAPGATVELPVTAAVDLAVEHGERLQDEPREFRLPSGHQAIEQDVTGRITVCNHRQVPVQLRVERTVPGQIDSQSPAGQHEQIPLHQHLIRKPRADGWWHRYSWPWWWALHNSVGKLTWECELPAGGSTELQYGYDYIWVP
ncbi:MAG: hypothetical protein ACOCXJ_00455 [Planctomycetota bacterium]